MPAKSTDYSKCKIYSLYHTDKDHVILVKFTTSDSVEECFANHKRRAKSSESSIYKWIQENGGWSAIEIHEHENYPCSNNGEIHERLKYWIDELKPITKHIQESMAQDQYLNGKIYKFVNDANEIVYVGSTKNTLEKRFSMHKYEYTKTHDHQTYVYKWIHNNGGFESIKIKLVEDYPCNSKQELEERERYWIEQLEPTANLNIPSRSKKEYKQLPEMKQKEKEYRERTRDVRLERGKQYRETHKEEVSQTKKDWYEQNKEKVRERMRRNYEANKDKKLEYQRQYSAANPVKIKEKAKKYRQDNPEKIREQQRLKREKMDKDAVKAYHKAYREKMKAEGRMSIPKDKKMCEVCNKMILENNFTRHCTSKEHIEKAKIHEEHTPNDDQQAQGHNNNETFI